MSETVLERSRANPGIKKDRVTGTVDVTFTNGLTTKDSADITLDPVHSETPKLTGCTIETVVETNSPTRGPVSIEVKTLNATTLAFTLYTTDPGGATKTTAFTVRYTLEGTIYDS